MSSQSTSESIEIPKEGCLGLLALGAVGLHAWRKARGEGPIPPLPRPAERPKDGRRRLLLIGWDAADWKVIHPLMDAGLMPTLESLVDRGVIGDLRTLDPPLSPMLWTSIATGKTADEHGVLGFVEPSPDGKSVRPIHGTARKCKAVWNILQQEGLKSHVVGWWPSHPAEPLHGVTVSNLYHRAVGELGEPWPPTPGSVHPEDLAETMAALRVHPQELGAEHLLPFIPNAAQIDQDKDRSIFSAAKILAEASTVHAAATWILENEDWDFMAVYLDAIDHFGHGFMKYHPPRRKHVPEQLYENNKNVVTAGYRFHDMMLERLLELAGEETTVMLISDHGFHPDHLRPRSLAREPAAPAAEHREHGIFCLAGPGIRRDERVEGAGLLDIAPTVLALFDRPVARDMPGKVLVQAFEDSPEIRHIESWEDVDGDSGGYSSEEMRDPWAEHEAMRQLVELGYVEEPGEKIEEYIQGHERESRFYLARVYLDRGRTDKALELFQALFAEDPQALRYGIHLATALINEQRFEEARPVFETVRRRAFEERDELRRMREERLRKHGVDVEEAGAASDGDSATQESDEKFAAPPAFVDYLEGRLLFGEGDWKGALQRLRRAEKAQPHLPRLHLALGDLYLRRGRLPAAERAFLQAVEIDPGSSSGYDGLCLVYLRRKQWEEAAGAALTAIGLQYFFPAAHFRLGEALRGMERRAEAAQAYEVCAFQAPGARRARERLVALYRDHLEEPAKAAAHGAALEQIEASRPASAQGPSTQAANA